MKQAYPDINEENDNEAQGLKCFGFIGINDRKLNRLFKLNKDLDTYNVKIKDFGAVDIDVKNMLKQNPDKRILQLSITAGHGMCKDGHQWMLLNEISNEGFYKMLPVEKTIRNWSNNFNNGYYIALFAGSREVYRYKYHVNCIGASSQKEAEQKIRAAEEEKNNQFTKIVK